MKPLILAVLCLPAIASASELETKTAKVLLQLAPPMLPANDRYRVNNEAQKVAISLASVGAYDAAKSVAARMTPDYDNPSNNFNATLDHINQITIRRKIAFVKAAEASVLVKSIKSPNLRINAIVGLANDAIKRGDMSVAHDYLLEIVRVGGAKVARNENLGVLFAQTNDMAAARRIFERQKSFLESEQPVVVYRHVRGETNTVPLRIDPRTVYKRVDTEDDWDELSAAFARAGLIREAVELSKQKVTFPTALSRELYKRGKLDEALELVQKIRFSSVKSRELAMWAISQLQSKPEKARETAFEAEKLAFDALSEKGVGAGRSEQAGFILVWPVMLALNAVGEEQRADTLLKDERWKLTAIEQARLKAMSLVFGAALQEKLKNWYEENEEVIPTVSTAQLVTMRASLLDLSAILPKAEEQRSEFITIALSVVEMHVKANDLQGAREVLGLVEKIASAPVAADSRDVQRLINQRLEIAKVWEKLGDEKSSKLWLNNFWNAPLFKGEVKEARVPTIMGKGFVVEGRAKLKPSFWQARTNLAEYWGWSEATSEARKNAPIDFPTWSAVIPAKERLIALNAFVETLERPILQPREENRINLDRDEFRS